MNHTNEVYLLSVTRVSTLRTFGAEPELRVNNPTLPFVGLAWGDIFGVDVTERPVTESGIVLSITLNEAVSCLKRFKFYARGRE